MPMDWKVWTLSKGSAIVCLQCEGHILFTVDRWGSRQTYLRWYGTSFSRLMPPDPSVSGWIFRQYGDGRANSPDTSSRPGLWHMHGISNELVESPSRHKPQEHQKLKHWWESHGPPRSMTHRVGNHITDMYYSGSTNTIPLKKFIVCPQ